MTRSREGATEIALPVLDHPRGPARRSPVFYNPAMARDRDLAVAIVGAWSQARRRPLDGWDMLASTGVRGLRLLQETAAFRSMVLTELSPQALVVLRQNASTWRDQGATTWEHDARGRLDALDFDFVDLDPFGTPVPFLPAALESVRLGGLIGIAATDMPVLAGVERGAAERRYGGRPVRGRLAPEGGLRLLLAHVARRAETIDRSIVPVAAYVHDHHVRAYLEVRARSERPPPVDLIVGRTWEGPYLGPLAEYGPMWLGPLFDRGIVDQLETPSTAQDPGFVEEYIARFQEESTVDRPFFYEPNEEAHRLRLTRPPSPRAVMDVLRSEGWSAGRTHARPAGFRTDAPRSVVEGTMTALSPRPRGEP